MSNLVKNDEIIFFKRACATGSKIFHGTTKKCAKESYLSLSESEFKSKSLKYEKSEKI